MNKASMLSSSSSLLSSSQSSPSIRTASSVREDKGDTKDEKEVRSTSYVAMETSKPQEQFVGSVEDFLCSICLEVPSPLTCVEHEECAHLFCITCFDMYKKTHSLMNHNKSVVCPYCKTDQGQFRQVKEKSKFIFRQMCSLKLRCDNYAKSAPTTTKQQQQQQEEEGRSSSTVNGEHKEIEKAHCDEVLEWQNLDAHVNACPMSPAQCKWKCNQLVQRRHLEEHEASCDMRCIKCTYCGQVMKHAEADEHHKTKCDKCPFTLVSCQYKDQGCSAKYVREMEEQHMQEAMAVHLSLMKSEYERLLEKTKEVKCEQMFNTKDEVQKQDFLAGGAKWEVIFYPKGNKAGKGTHLSLYLRLIAAISKVRVKFSFSVLLKSGQWMKLEALHELSVGGDWGWHKFVSLGDCPNDWLFVTTTMHQIEFLA